MFFCATSFAQSPKILAFGDSLTAGYQLSLADAFPAKLEARLKGVSIVNGGVSGDTTQAGLERLEWTLTPDVKGVILELGANDALRGLSPAVTAANLERMIELLQARKIKVLLAGMQASPSMGQAYSDKFNAIFPQLAQKYNLIYYPFFLEGIAGRAAFNLADGMHPNPQGVEVIVTNILPFVEKLVKEIEN